MARRSYLTGEFENTPELQAVFARWEQATAVKLGLLFIGLGTVIVGSEVTAIAVSRTPEARQKTVYRLYDLNCRAGMKSYRYPRDVVWLAEGEIYGSWNRVLTCRLVKE